MCIYPISIANAHKREYFSYLFEFISLNKYAAAHSKLQNTETSIGYVLFSYLIGIPIGYSLN